MSLKHLIVNPYVGTVHEAFAEAVAAVDKLLENPEFTAKFDVGSHSEVIAVFPLKIEMIDYRAYNLAVQGYIEAGYDDVEAEPNLLGWYDVDVSGDTVFVNQIYYRTQAAKSHRVLKQLAFGTVLHEINHFLRSTTNCESPQEPFPKLRAEFPLESGDWFEVRNWSGLMNPIGFRCDHNGVQIPEDDDTTEVDSFEVLGVGLYVLSGNEEKFCRVPYEWSKTIELYMAGHSYGLVEFKEIELSAPRKRTCKHNEHRREVRTPPIIKLPGFYPRGNDRRGRNRAQKGA